MNTILISYLSGDKVVQDSFTGAKIGYEINGVNTSGCIKVYANSAGQDTTLIVPLTCLVTLKIEMSRK